MQKVFHTLHHHIKHHHKKYLFGIFGGFAVVKLLLLVVWWWVVTDIVLTNAQLASWCTLTGQYYTGEYTTWGYLTGQELTWWSLTGCIIEPWYLTWGALDESGNLTGQTRIEESQTWCFLTGQILSEWYFTGWYLTWGYLTWWSLTWCIQEIENTQSSGNAICESWDIRWITPLSWSVLRDIFPINLVYSWTDCLVSGLSLQLRDHNNQWISLGTLASWTTSFAFDSKKLYSFQQSWFYHIIWNTGAWNFSMYTWTYTGVYKRLWTWYIVRLLDGTWISLYETPTFTIDNESPLLTGIVLQSSWSSPWYLNISWVVILTFTASEELANLNVTLWSGTSSTSSSLSWLFYTYTRHLNSLYPEGALVATIAFADTAGNTWNVFSPSSLIFDKTKAIVTWFVFDISTGGLRLSYLWSEVTSYTVSYQRTWWILFTGSSIEYLTGQQVIFTGLEKDQAYVFNLNIFDRAGNIRVVTGDFMLTSLGNIASNIYLLPLVAVDITTGTLVTLASTLKFEVEKFNACKTGIIYTTIELTIKQNPFTLQMPNFQKEYIKTLVSAFTLFIMDKVKNNATISIDEMNNLTKKFNDFLIILKLLRDDDNTCKQNLSNYYIIQFKNVLQEYNINLE